MITLKSCPRCNGARYADLDGPSCLHCGWAGPTRPAPPLEPEGRIEHAFDHSRSDPAQKYLESHRRSNRAYMARRRAGGA